MDKFINREIKSELNSSNEWLCRNSKTKSQSQSIALNSNNLDKKIKRKTIKKESLLQNFKSPTSTSKITDDCKKVLKNLRATSFKEEHEKLSLKCFDKKKGSSLFY